MSFSRLLLVAANSKKYIIGEKEKDKVYISPRIFLPGRDAYEGEVVLCFQLDERSDEEKRVARSLGILDDDKRCDGLVFYAQDGKDERVICLVEMKSTNLDVAPAQLESTKKHIETLLREECKSLPEEYQKSAKSQITYIAWKACVYHHGASQEQLNEIDRKLKDAGFSDVAHLTGNASDLRPLLTGERGNARAMGKKVKNQRRR